MPNDDKTMQSEERCTLPQNDREIRNRMDDLVFKMRMLAGSGDVDGAHDLLLDVLNTVRMAHDNHVKWMSEEATATWLYVCEMNEVCLSNIRGLPKDNRSQTAKEARMYRAKHGKG